MPKVKEDAHTPYTEELHALIQRAQQGDHSVMPRLKELLDEIPELCQQVGDLAAHVESAWLKLLAGKDLFTQECLRRELDQRRAELLGDKPTPMERQLVEGVLACWLHLKYAEFAVANSPEASTSHQKLLQKRLAQAQRQHLSALRMLTAEQKSSRRAKKKRQQEKKPKQNVAASHRSNGKRRRRTEGKPSRRAGKSGCGANRMLAYMDRGD